MSEDLYNNLATMYRIIAFSGPFKSQRAWKKTLGVCVLRKVLHVRASMRGHEEAIGGYVIFLISTAYPLSALEIEHVIRSRTHYHNGIRKELMV